MVPTEQAADNPSLSYGSSPHYLFFYCRNNMLQRGVKASAAFNIDPQAFGTGKHDFLTSWHLGKKDGCEKCKSQSPVLGIAERRRENDDNVAFTWSKCCSCNNIPNTLVKLRSKHYYLCTEAHLRRCAMELVLSKIELFSSS